jgi:AcrR family transcriptional regulator
MKRFSLSSAALSGPDEAEPPKRRGNRHSRVPQILDVSIKVLTDAGYGGYTINRVANDAGIRLSTLQHYFANREILLRATLEEIGKRYFDRLRALADHHGRTPEERLAAIVDDAYTELSKPGFAAPILEAWGLALHETYAHDVVAGVQKEFQALLANLVGQINPSLSIEERDMRGALLTSSLQGLTVFLRWTEYSTARRQEFRKTMKVVWKGLSGAE